MTFKDMYQRVQFTLGMEDSVPNDETLLAKAYINEGIIDVLVRTRPYTRCVNLNVSANTPVHDMSNLILALVDIVNPSGQGFLTRLTREDAVTAQQNGNPGYAFEEPLLWLSPVSSADTVVQAYGIFRPASLVADSDDPSTPAFGGLAPEFHPAVVNYALWKGGEYLQHEQSGGGERWRTTYEGQDGQGGDISRIKKILTKRATLQGTARRDLTRNLGSVSASGAYLAG